MKRVVVVAILAGVAAVAQAAPPSPGAQQRACAAKKYDACFDLGQRYADGQGVARDPAKAVLLLQQACDGRIGAACRRLGDIFYKRACEAGDCGGASAAPAAASGPTMAATMAWLRTTLASNARVTDGNGTTQHTVVDFSQCTLTLRRTRRTYGWVYTIPLVDMAENVALFTDKRGFTLSSDGGKPVILVEESVGVKGKLDSIQIGMSDADTGIRAQQAFAHLIKLCRAAQPRTAEPF